MAGDNGPGAVFPTLVGRPRHQVLVSTMLSSSSITKCMGN